MKEIAERKFLSLFDDKGASAFSDLRFERCVFTNCVLADTKDPSKRSHVRNVQLVDCSEVGCSVGPAVLEDVVIDGLKTSDLFHYLGRPVQARDASWSRWQHQDQRVAGH